MQPDAMVNILFALRYSVHMQSWTKTEENDAMWRIYSQSGEGVQISTTLRKAHALHGVSSVQVRYRELRLVQELKRIFQGNKMQLAQVFATKRTAFSYEKELRLITSIDIVRVLQKKQNDWLEPGILRELMGKLADNGEIDAAGVRTVMRQLIPNWLNYVPFEHVPDFIESVRVNPFATSAFVEAVRLYCEEKKIRFLGKSELYKPVV